MAAYNLEEQETIEILKAWWKDYGKLVLLMLLAFLLSIAAVQGWQFYQRGQAVEAAALYAELIAAQTANDAKRIQEIAGTFTQSFSGSGYAVLAQLQAAKASYEAGDKDAATAPLRWVIAEASETAAQDAARLRLAGIYLDKKDYEQALQLLQEKHGAAFNALYADRRGDVLVAQGKIDEARAAYQQALEQGDAQSNYRNLIQLKLDGLGAAREAK
ncbi:MAG: YfgM family protein [Burkholderiales bacterium]|nr:tetratricopeptide repeat protein [Burkholderiales bacterium]MDQ3196264.1 tetratricopeptide repeat protein [Pseudomonadota bacterium]